MDNGASLDTSSCRRECGKDGTDYGWARRASADAARLLLDGGERLRKMSLIADSTGYIPFKDSDSENIPAVTKAASAFFVEAAATSKPGASKANARDEINEALDCPRMSCIISLPILDISNKAC